MEYEFHPWEIYDGKGCPVEPGEMGQVQLNTDTLEVAMGRQVRDLSKCGWAAGRDRHSFIHAFRRVKQPETRYFSVAQLLYDGCWLTKKQVSADTHRLLFDVVDGEPVNPRFERIEK